MLEFMPFLALLKLGRTYIMEEKIAKEIFTEEIFVELMLQFTTSIAKFISQNFSKLVNCKNFFRKTLLNSVNRKNFFRKIIQKLKIKNLKN